MAKGVLCRSVAAWTAVVANAKVDIANHGRALRWRSHLLSRLLCRVIGMWRSRSFLWHCVCQIQLKIARQGLQAALWKWMTTTQDMGTRSEWQGLAIRADARCGRQVIAAYFGSLRRQAKEDLLVHAKDLLSLHQELGKVRVQMHDRSTTLTSRVVSMCKIRDDDRLYRESMEAWVGAVQRCRMLRMMVQGYMEQLRRSSFRRCSL